jgi:nucleoside-diphosphate-sugar epimerase
MKVLVTGAAGRLGSVVCDELSRQGYDVLGTDQRLAAGLKVPLRLADLRQELAVYPLLEGRDAVVHLGNHASLHGAVTPATVLTENVAMNSNVFQAASDLGVKRIVFASSLQAMVRLDDGRQTSPPYTLPYFPLDGLAPANPGHNFYGLSKEFGERTLQLLAQRWPERCYTALRFPMLAGEQFLKRIAEPVARSALNWGEGLTYLPFADAAALVALVLQRQQPGYHQYFPAQALEVRGLTAAQLIDEFFPETPRRPPRAEIERLVDLGALEADLGFRPAPPLTIELVRL